MPRSATPKGRVFHGRWADYKSSRGRYFSPAPFLLAPVILTAPAAASIPLQAWLGFLYLIVVSQFLGFVPWYRALTLGGIAKVSQVQLLQPFLTILASGLLLGEPGDMVTWIVALLVVVVVALSRSARVVR
ncbi:MAG: EamA family transporter [Burkholderiales bacterium]